LNVGKGFKELAEKGVAIRVCNLCLLVRGTGSLLMKRKSESGGLIKRAGTPDLAKIVTNSDKLIVIC